MELWGGRIDRSADELLEVFDELEEALAMALSSHLKLAEEERFRRTPPDKLEAWMLATRASQTYFRNPTTSLDDSLALAQRATRVDPNYGYAWAVVGFLTALKFPLAIAIFPSRSMPPIARCNWTRKIPGTWSPRASPFNTPGNLPNRWIISAAVCA